MKSEEEIIENLKEHKDLIKFLYKDTDVYIYQEGWINAIKYVLDISELEVESEV